MADGTIHSLSMHVAHFSVCCCKFKVEWSQLNKSLHSIIHRINKSTHFKHFWSMDNGKRRLLLSSKHLQNIKTSKQSCPSATWWKQKWHFEPVSFINSHVSKVYAWFITHQICHWQKKYIYNHTKKIARFSKRFESTLVTEFPWCNSPSLSSYTIWLKKYTKLLKTKDNNTTNERASLI